MLRGMALTISCLLIGAAPAEVPIGKFQTWVSSAKRTVTFISGGVKVHVEALPCPARPVGDGTCGFEGYNNQAVVTVSGHGSASLSVTTDSQSSYARIAVVRFARNDPHPGVIIESQSGGSGGTMTFQVLIPDGDGYRAVAADLHNGRSLEGELKDFPRDLSGDGIVDLELRDGAFDSAFGCNACTPRPPVLIAVKAGRIVDESRDPTLRAVFAEEMARMAPFCLSNKPDRNGACAAYVADAARAGRFEAAWGAMLSHYEHDQQWWQPCPVVVTGACPKTSLKPFPDALRAYLIKTGYIPRSMTAGRS